MTQHRATVRVHQPARWLGFVALLASACAAPQPPTATAYEAAQAPRGPAPEPAAAQPPASLGNAEVILSTEQQSVPLDSTRRTNAERERAATGSTTVSVSPPPAPPPAAQPIVAPHATPAPTTPAAVGSAAGPAADASPNAPSYRRPASGGGGTPGLEEEGNITTVDRGGRPPSIAALESRIQGYRAALRAPSPACPDICAAAGGICEASREICRLTGDIAQTRAHDPRCQRAQQACTDASQQRDATCAVCPPAR